MICCMALVGGQACRFNNPQNTYKGRTISHITGRRGGGPIKNEEKEPKKHKRLGRKAVSRDRRVLQ